MQVMHSTRNLFKAIPETWKGHRKVTEISSNSLPIWQPEIKFPWQLAFLEKVVNYAHEPKETFIVSVVLNLLPGKWTTNMQIKDKFKLYSEP